MTDLQNAKMLSIKYKKQCAEQFRAANKTDSKRPLGSWHAAAQKSFEEQKKAQLTNK